jgi:tetratricopeptide (TPR) repeat protein
MRSVLELFGGKCRNSVTLPNMKGSVFCFMGLIVAFAVARGLPSFASAANAQQAPHSARQHEELGEHELKTKDFAQAVKEFRTALSLDPGSVAAHVGLGVALQETGDAVGAVTQFQKAIQLDPRDAAAHYHLGVAFGRQGNLEEAKAELLQTLELKPDSADAHYTLGLLLVDWPYPKDFPGAAKQFEEALKYKPNFPEAYEELGEVFLTLGNWNAALAQFRAAVKLKPAFPEAYCGIGLALKRKGDLDGAFEAYRYALRLRPEDGETHYQLGLVLMRQKKLDDAIAEFREAIKLRPSDETSYYDLGRALSLKGQTQAAKLEFQKARDLHNQNIEETGQAVRLNNAGVALMQGRRFAQAETKFRSALDINPTYGVALFNLGLVLAAQGEFKSAITEFRKALAQEPINPKIHFDLARALELDGNLTGAIREFQLTLRLHPGYPGAQEALEQALQNQQAAIRRPFAASRPEHVPHLSLNTGLCIRARLQPCRSNANKMAALAAATDHQGLKPLALGTLPSARLNPCPDTKPSAIPRAGMTSGPPAVSSRKSGTCTALGKSVAISQPRESSVRGSAASMIVKSPATPEAVSPLAPLGERVASGASRVRGSTAATTVKNPATPSLEQCEQTVNALSDHTPSSPASLRLAALCAFGLNDFPRAIPLLTKAAQLNPRDEEMQILLARAYAGVGRHERAIETLKAWTKAHGDDVDALYWTGKFYDELASQAFQQMAEKYPQNYLVYETEGNQLTIKQQFPQALALYEKALTLAPKNTPGLHFHVGDIYWRTLRYPKAENELQQELRINPYHAEANYELGAIYAKEGDPEKAVALLNKAIALDPSLIAAHRSLGQAYLDVRQYSLALAQFLVVAEANPSDYTIRNMLATTYRMLGRLADARREAAESQKLYAQYIRNFQAIQAGEQKLPK